MPTTQFIYHVEPLANISCWNKPVFSAQVKASFQTTAVQLRTLSRIFTFAKPVLCRCQSPSISAATGCTDDGVEGHNAGLTHCCAPGIEDFIGFLTFLWKSWEGLGYSSVRLNSQILTLYVILSWCKCLKLLASWHLWGVVTDPRPSKKLIHLLSIHNVS